MTPSGRGEVRGGGERSARLTPSSDASPEVQARIADIERQTSFPVRSSYGGAFGQGIIAMQYVDMPLAAGAKFVFGIVVQDTPTADLKFFRGSLPARAARGASDRLVLSAVGRRLDTTQAAPHGSPGAA